MRNSKNIMIYGASGCGACASELRMLFTSVFDIQRHGICITGNPKTADALIIAGGLNERSARIVKNLRAQMPEGSFAVSAGDCAVDGCRIAYADDVVGADKVLDIDMSLAGCPILPQNMIEALKRLFGKGGGEPDEDN